MFGLYVVRPHPDGNGFQLFGPKLPFPLRYLSEFDAARMAEHLGKTTGGRVAFLNQRGHLIISETIEREFEESCTTPPDHNRRLLEIAKAEFGDRWKRA